MMATMAEFLQKGCLGDIMPGITMERAKGILGSPDDWSASQKAPHLLRYGAVELCFSPIPGTEDSRLVTIAIYFQDPSRSIPKVMRPTDWLPPPDITEQEFRARLADTGIQAHSSVSGENHYLVLPSGASIVFADNKLHSVHYKRASHRGTRRQVSVSLPAETVDRLQERAKQEGLSMPRFLERIIKEKANR